MQQFISSSVSDSVAGSFCAGRRRLAKALLTLKFRTLRWVVPLLLAALTGCSSRAMHHVYDSYSVTYADSVNRQLLLNLARLAHDEPPYFIQLGQMNSQFTFNSSAGFTPSQARVANWQGTAAKAVQDTVTLGGTLSAGATETPTFQFVPLNGDAFAQAIYAPIPDKLFYTFYDQGFHADILLRTMVAYVKIIREVPTKFGTNKEVATLYVNQPHSPTYPDFLRFCEGLRKAQVEQSVIVENAQTEGPTRYSDVKLADAQAAIAAGFTVTNFPSGSNFQVFPRKSFRLTPVGDIDRLAFLPEARDAFASGHIVLNMRTFIAAMYGVAKEEVYWKEFKGKPAAYPENSAAFSEDKSGYRARIESANLRDFQLLDPVRPILTLSSFSDDERARLVKLVEISHDGVKYTVGDVEGADAQIGRAHV